MLNNRWKVELNGKNQIVITLDKGHFIYSAFFTNDDTKTFIRHCCWSKEEGDDDLPCTHTHMGYSRYDYAKFLPLALEARSAGEADFSPEAMEALGLKADVAE